MKQIKVKFINLGFFKDRIISVLKDKFCFLECDEPDFVFVSAEKWSECVFYDCVRILVSGENIRPDFNYFDYAITFDDIIYGDRNLCYPYFLWKQNCELAINKHERFNEDIFLKKTKFCNFIYRNGINAYPIRKEMFDKLSKYKQVDSAGGYLNNMNGWMVPYAETVSFRENYKFSIAFENSPMRGYTTEKIVNAWSGLTIPIYWGDPEVSKYFNTNAFINVNDFSSLDEVVERVIQIDKDDELYWDIMKTPILADDSPVRYMMRKNYISDYLEHILSQDPVAAIRRTSKDYGWSAFMERDLLRHVEMDNSKLVKLAYWISQKLRL